ncbi:hypothetical protein ANTHELSMS3_03285 [Antarctobacter heliothermus]|uniref:Uncharacterized protein n=1 Tax=Antarctobacter heliothermus TaxID=74033 RepID=A0A222E6T3_9RHOB|nr:hypothetical protein ANTHELSMS3_03285 [Antarctobacter heliothermus]
MASAVDIAAHLGTERIFASLAAATGGTFTRHERLEWRYLNRFPWTR